ncbi:uncharacterized protein LOC134247159 [Saccostrea cucullata]|uniref:uncharacterized protein LOC134247159 n=1 Tax=Saccostrea cuccullata TaxID=36930 RepID=UPI002ED2E83A
MDTDIELLEKQLVSEEALTRQKQVLAIRLQRAIRENKLHEVKDFIKQEADVDYKDKTGSAAIHYASQGGNLEIVNILIDAEANVNTFDRNYHTPLHKAAMRGHLHVAIALVAAGAQVCALDWENYSSFEKSILNKHYEISKVLMLFGAEPFLKDWDWIEDDLSKTQIDVLHAIEKSISLLTGYQHGYVLLQQILYNVAKIKPESEHRIEHLGVTIDSTKEKSEFFFFCRKLALNYTDIKLFLLENEVVKGDVFELQTWKRVSRKTLRLIIDIDGITRPNEHLKLISPDGDVGKIHNYDKLQEENITRITIDIHTAPKGTVSFAVTSIEKEETFAISRESQDIYPISEPEAEIHLPKDAFENVAELKVKVMESSEANNDEAESTGPLILTNVIDLTISDKQQPKKEIAVKLPIHHSQGDEEMCVLATSQDEPDDADDWEVLDAMTDPSSKTTTFKINHFSVYAGASKKNVSNNKQAVVDAVQRSRKRERKVVMRAFIRPEMESGTFSLVLECLKPRNLWKRKPRWELDGYQLMQSNLGPFIVPENQMFRIGFSQNIEIIDVENIMKKGEEQLKEKSEEKNDDEYNLNIKIPHATLNFVGSKNKGHNFTVIKIKSDENQEISGKVKVEKEVQSRESVKQEVADVGCGLFKVIPKKHQVKMIEKTKTTYETLVDFPISLQLSSNEQISKGIYNTFTFIFDLKI